MRSYHVSRTRIMSGKKRKGVVDNRYTQALEQEIKKVGEAEVNNSPLSLINRRRRQVLVHSCIYYRFNENIVSDHTFDRWCRELIELQAKYPDIASLCPYHEEFKGLSHASGFDLPYNNPEIVNRAIYLIQLRKSK